jgi:Leucine-rich repeat (LRR) protein
MQKLTKILFLCFTLSLSYFLQNHGMQNFNTPTCNPFNPWTIPSPNALNQEGEIVHSQSNQQMQLLIPFQPDDNESLYAYVNFFSSSNNPMIPPPSLFSSSTYLQTAEEYKETPNTTTSSKNLAIANIKQLNDLFFENDNSLIAKKNSQFEEWLNNIPPSFRTLIIEEIISAAKKYLSPNFSSQDPSFFESLPDNSLIKIALCFVSHFQSSNIDELIQNSTNPAYTFLLGSIKKFIKKNSIITLFNPITHSLKVSNPNELFFIKLFPKLFEVQNYLKNGFPQKREIFLSHILALVEPYFKIHPTTLDLSINLLNNVPSSVFLLEHLQELRLNNNKIMILIKDIEHLKFLEILDLHNNNLQKIPKELLRLPKLRELNLANNPSLKHDSQSQQIIKKLTTKGVKIEY